MRGFSKSIKKKTELLDEFLFLFFKNSFHRQLAQEQEAMK